jgi:hypothetical protein
VNARAVMIAKIATGEIKDVTTDDGKNAAAVALGQKGVRPAPSLCRRRGGQRLRSWLRRSGGGLSSRNLKGCLPFVIIGKSKLCLQDSFFCHGDRHGR